MILSQLRTNLWHSSNSLRLFSSHSKRSLHHASNELTLFDGSMGGILLAKGHIKDDSLWSAGVLIDNPSAVKALHQEYIKAGANVITTNTYATIPHYLKKKNLEHEFARLTRLGGQLAREAVLESNRQIKIAGSLPPLGESYRPQLTTNNLESRLIYATMAEQLASYVDIFLCETMSSIQEAVNAVEAIAPIAEKNNIPIYVSFTLHEEPGKGLRSGEDVLDILNKISPDSVSAYLFNCTSPAAIESAIQVLSKRTNKPMGGMPNRLNPVPKDWSLDKETTIPVNKGFTEKMFVQSALSCIDAGATIYGGCCGIGPKHILALSEAIQQRLILNDHEEPTACCSLAE